VCGRFVSTTSVSKLETLFSTQPSSRNLSPSYNVAPSAEVYGVVAAAGSRERRIEVFQWGLDPKWQTADSTSSTLINARFETVDVKPTFSDAFKHRRCLVPADGFYEWQGAQKRTRRRPFYIYKSDHAQLAMAGIWEPGPSKGQASVVILTRESDIFMSKIHNRMPLTLNTSLWDEWLDPTMDDAGALKRLVMSESTEVFDAHQVDPKVGNPQHDRPENVAPVPADTLW